ncbi:MAG: hypothetical protein ACTHY5_10415, partial [Oceanisphaera sp.]|uniref:hypothetical protein n=1 Tax=Oceanisphaera sp. TaxID=1929979 RepID=UPI003F9DBF27
VRLPEGTTTKQRLPSQLRHILYNNPAFIPMLNQIKSIEPNGQDILATEYTEEHGKIKVR